MTGKKPRATLTRKKIVEAALVLVREDGIDFSMRKLGTALSVWPMAVYRHFANREDLVEAIIDTVLGEVLDLSALPDFQNPRIGWKRRLNAFSVHLYRVLLNYPGVAQKVLYGVLYTPNGQRLVEISVGFLVGLGVAPRRAAIISQAIGTFVLNAATLETARRQGEASTKKLYKALSSPSGESQPAQEYIETYIAVVGSERLEAGLGLFVTAIEAELA